MRALVLLRVAGLGMLLLLLGEPVLEMISNRVVSPVILLLIDSSASMSLAAGDSTRLERVQQTLALPRLRAALADARIRPWRFDERPVPLNLDTLDSVTAKGRATDVARALREALDRDPRRSSVRAVLLISDGAHNLGGDPVTAALEAGVPVYAATVGARGHPPDVLIRAVRGGEGACLGQDVLLQIEVCAWAFPGRRAVVTVVEDAQRLASADVVLAADGEITTLSLPVRPLHVGSNLLQVSISALPGEAALDNNEILMDVDVSEHRLRLLLTGTAPSVDFAFIRRALAADSSLSVHVPPRLSAVALRGSLDPVLTADDAYDALILVDPGRPVVSDEIAAGLAAWVRRGGGLLLVLGARTAAQWDATGPLAALLPVELGNVPRLISTEVSLHLGAIGPHHPVVRRSAGGGGEDRWRRLPPLPSYFGVTGLKPQAIPLVVGGDGGESPIIVVGQVEQGRIVTVLGTDLWRLDLVSSGAGRDPHTVREFWQDAVRWLAVGRSWSRVQAWTQQRIYRSGKPVSIGAHVLDEFLRPLEGAQVALIWSGTKEPLPLADVGGGDYRIQWPAMEAGAHRFTVSASFQGAPLGRDEGHFVIEPYSLESMDMRADPEALEELAHATGGYAMPLAQWPELLAKMPLHQRVERQRAVHSLWPHTWALVLALVLLLGEWILRKRSGMI